MALKKAGLLAMKGGCRLPTWEIELLQMLEVTIIGSHSNIEALDTVCHRLVDVFLRQLYLCGLQGSFATHQWSLSWRLWCFSSVTPHT